MDLIPEGHISLVDAFGRYAEAILYVDPDKVADGALKQFKHLGEARLDKARKVLALSFARGNLTAFVHQPGEATKFKLPREGWRELGDYAERLFMAEEVPHFADSPWAGLSGRTPFVEERRFSDWLSVLNPMAKPQWSLGAAVAWIVWRTPDRVLSHWDKSLSLLLLGDDEVVLEWENELATDDEAKPEDSGRMTISHAWRELLIALQEGKVTARAGGEAISTADWKECRLSTGTSASDDRLQDGENPLAVKHTNIWIDREELCARWRAPRHRQAAPVSGADRQVNSAELKSKPMITLADAIWWIFAVRDTGEERDEWSALCAASHELFDALDGYQIDVWGKLNESPKYDPMPLGIWAEMTMADESPLFFSLIGDGVVCFGRNEWHAPRIRTEEVVKRWPLPSADHQPEPPSLAASKAVPGASELKQAVKELKAIQKQGGYLQLTRGNVEGLLSSRFPNCPRAAIRDALALHFPAAARGQRNSGQKRRKNRELEEIRQKFISPQRRISTA